MALKITYPNGEVVTIQTAQLESADVQELAEKIADNWQRNRGSEGELSFEVVPNKEQADTRFAPLNVEVKGLK